jgi:uncharacterized protein YndB with AHSA1/START domain
MSAPHAAAGENEMVHAREFNAPRETVFAAWAEARQIDRWFGPRGFTTVTQRMEFRPGGVWHHVMTGPDGHPWVNHIRYVEIVAPARIVYDNHGGDADAAVSFRATVTLTALPGAPARCRVEMRGAFATVEAREQAVRDHHADEGGRQTLERLGEYVQRIAGAPRITEATMRRTFRAPRAAVWRAWVEPEQLRRWWGPHGFTNPVCELDPRVGGAIRIHMRAPDGTVYPMTGTVEAVQEPERLVLRCQARDDLGGVVLEVVNTVTFAESAGSTTVQVHARVLDATADGALHLAGMEQGWTGSLDRLAALLSGGRA